MKQSESIDMTGVADITDRTDRTMIVRFPLTPNRLGFHTKAASTPFELHRRSQKNGQQKRHICFHILY